MLDKIKKYAKDNRVPIVNDEGLAFLKENIEKYKCVNILELGSAIGYSAIMMSNINDNILVETIEKDETRYNEAVNNIKEMKLNDRIKIHFMDALDFETDEKYDMIFLDLAKSKYDIMLNKFYPNLNEGGIIIVDNLGMYGLVFEEKLKVRRQVRQLVEKIKKFRHNIENDKRFDCHIYDDIGDGIGVLVKRKEG